MAKHPIKPGWKTSEFWLCIVLTAWTAYQGRPKDERWPIQAVYVAMQVLPTLYYTSHRRHLKIAALEMHDGS
jgi:hypothetical protein